MHPQPDDELQIDTTVSEKVTVETLGLSRKFLQPSNFIQSVTNLIPQPDSTATMFGQAIRFASSAGASTSNVYRTSANFFNEWGFYGSSIARVTAEVFYFTTAASTATFNFLFIFNSYTNAEQVNAASTSEGSWTSTAPCSTIAGGLMKHRVSSTFQMWNGPVYELSGVRLGVVPASTSLDVLVLGVNLWWEAQSTKWLEQLLLQTCPRPIRE
jgi:hypothetical protein